MRELLEKILRIDELYKGREVDWGFIDPAGRINNEVESHYFHAKEYYKKRGIPLPRGKGSCVGVVSKFLGLAKNIRYTTRKGKWTGSPAVDEIDFQIVGSVSSAQMRTIRRLSKERDIVYEITDEQGHSIEYGIGMQDMVDSLRRENLLEKVNELDVKRGLRTTAAAALIGAGAAGLGYQKHLSQKPVEKPAVTMEEPAAQEEEPKVWQTVKMRVTAYCPCPKCTGTDSPGITASGHKIQSGDVFVAADKRFDFGTEMIIPGYNDDQPVEVLDRGGAIKGDRIDVFFPTHEEALEWGVKNLDVEVQR